MYTFGGLSIGLDPQLIPWKSFFFIVTDFIWHIFIGQENILIQNISNN